jgi:hypothetical protein
MSRPYVRRCVNKDIAGHEILAASAIDQPRPDPAEPNTEGSHNVCQRHALLGASASGFLRRADVGRLVLAHRPEHELGVPSA